MPESINFFFEYKHLAVIVHVFAVIIGMGSALISDILFNLYIKDKKINPTENSTLQILSKIIWICLVAIVLTGLFIFMSDPLTYAYSDKFLLKMIVVAVLIINGLLFWKVTHKAIKKINFRDTNINHRYVRVRKLSFAFGAISVVSWLMAFVLGSIDSIPVTLSLSVILYGIILFGAILASQIVDHLMTRRK